VEGICCDIAREYNEPINSCEWDYTRVYWRERLFANLEWILRLDRLPLRGPGGVRTSFCALQQPRTSENWQSALPICRLRPTSSVKAMTPALASLLSNRRKTDMARRTAKPPTRGRV